MTGSALSKGPQTQQKGDYEEQLMYKIRIVFGLVIRIIKIISLITWRNVFFHKLTWGAEGGWRPSRSPQALGALSKGDPYWALIWRPLKMLTKDLVAVCEWCLEVSSFKLRGTLLESRTSRICARECDRNCLIIFHGKNRTTHGQQNNYSIFQWSGGQLTSGEWSVDRSVRQGVAIMNLTSVHTALSFSQIQANCEEAVGLFVERCLSLPVTLAILEILQE